MTPTFTDPITRIEWRDAATLDANDYNPNVVFTPELRLLEASILETGWVQPILINRAGIIIDGFHRATMAVRSEAVRARYHGLVPCAVLDVDRPTAMVMTIRMNRAKGTHVAVRMSAIVKELIDLHGLPLADLAKRLGATRDEIDLLYNDNVFKARNLKNAPYSRAWEPRAIALGERPPEQAEILPEGPVDGEEPLA